MPKKKKRTTSSRTKKSTKTKSKNEDSKPQTALLPSVVNEARLPARTSSALAPTDPLRQYLKEIQQYDLLDPEEEFELAERMHSKGDVAAAKRLVSANLRLVVKIAFEYRSAHTNVMDLIQEGNIGLMKAVSKFDPSKGAKLSYYASWWIRSYILRYILDNFRLVKIGTTQAQKKLFYQLMKEKERLEAQGLSAGPKLLAEKLDVKEKEVVEMQHRLSAKGSELSIDSPIKSDDQRTRFADLLEDDSSSMDDNLARAQLIEILRNQLPDFQKQLKEKEMVVLKERVLSDDPKTLQEIADQYQLTRERVRQIEAKLIDKLRTFVKDQMDLR